MAAEPRDRHAVMARHDDAGEDNSASTLFASTPIARHMMKIQGYSWMRKTYLNGDAVSSRPFRVGDSTSWHIGFYPNGKTPEAAGFVSVKIVLRGACISTAVKATVVFDVLDPVSGNPVPRYTRTTGEVLKFAGEGAYWSCDDFIERGELERLLLKDDSFTVSCSVTVVHVVAYEYDALPPPRSVVGVDVPPSDWSQHFRDLLRSGEGADVRLQVAGETFDAHRCVLAARSPVFRAELYGAMKESVATERCVQVGGMRAEVFKNLLHFAYTDSLPPLTGTAEDEDEIAMAQHLMEAADRYGMERLKLLCEDRLCRRISVRTAATTLALAEQHQCKGLKDACLEFLLESPPNTLDEVMATQDFDHLSKSCPALLKELMSKLAARCSYLTEKVALLSAYKKKAVRSYTDSPENKEKRRKIDANM